MGFTYKEDYFIKTVANIDENLDLREPQRFAYFEIYRHFEIDKKNSTPAIVVLPTGVGKTGVIGIIPYNISKGRVLVITPQITIKETVIDSLDPDSCDNFWISKNVISKTSDLPVVVEYDGNKTKKSVLDAANIVILNIHKLQSRLESSLINRKGIDTDYFDMIIIDEAHHSTANTWVETVQYFCDAKVVKLTGTPIRTDGQKMAGELVYKYKLSQAMADGFVKSLVNIDYVPSDLKLTMDENEDKLYSVEEILKIKDEDWISRAVAFSKECSEKVVDSSIKILKEKKLNSRVPHKIIAVACSIKHAEFIKSLYLTKGIRVDVIHSNLTEDVKDKIKNDIKNNRLDAIINVGMLGEGYDHKYLSVAAIFRPFRSELPYSQFIGRILRTIPEDEISTPEDNIGRIVSHNNLYLQDLWEKYKIEIQESEVIKHLKDIDELNDMKVSKESSNTQEIDIGKAIEDGNGILIEDPYINTELIRRRKIEKEEMERKIAEIRKAFGGIEREDAIKLIEQVESSKTSIKRPDKYFINTQKNLDVEIRDIIVPGLITKFKIAKEEKTLSNCILFNGRYQWIKSKGKDNAAMLAMYFNDYLRMQIGLPRDKWSIDDYGIAQQRLNSQVEYVEKILETL